MLRHVAKSQNYPSEYSSSALQKPRLEQESNDEDNLVTRDERFTMDDRLHSLNGLLQSNQERLN